MRSARVYSGEPRLANQALIVLRRAGLPAELLNEPSPVVRQKSWFGLKVDVVVPESEAARAREVLQQWTMESDKSAAPLSRSVGWGLAFVFVPPLTAFAATTVLNMPGPDWLTGACIGWVLAAVAVIAVVQRRSNPDRGRR